MSCPFSGQRVQFPQPPAAFDVTHPSIPERRECG
eukprot:CAMPEP_0204237722 /NCGR_PEP_ID=MMETSP0361-20130328/93469_1 /ASSEMBLY_ACC=CAM_ASM_000343 /TAXON_ID=268821 /ORGANISM="Scrippsiella Hangoei, Strain SHTV-5" /LENGTH=33 /DNA_ID= /DNA_START= /DNA_END= /DNA_ORIENTATION=